MKTTKHLPIKSITVVSINRYNSKTRSNKSSIICTICHTFSNIFWQPIHPQSLNLIIKPRYIKFIVYIWLRITDTGTIFIKNENIFFNLYFLLIKDYEHVRTLRSLNFNLLFILRVKTSFRTNTLF